jgi:protein disulfide-isomerase A4
VLKIAKEFGPTFNFAISDEEDFAKELEEVGLGESGRDVNVACFGKDGRRYPLLPADDDDELTEDSFQ